MKVNIKIIEKLKEESCTFYIHIFSGLKYIICDNQSVH